MCPLIPYCWLIKQLNLWGTQEGCVKKKILQNIIKEEL